MAAQAKRRGNEITGHILKFHPQWAAYLLWRNAEEEEEEEEETTEMQGNRAVGMNRLKTLSSA